MSHDVRYFTILIAGAEMLMHNSQLADPLNPFTKQLKAISAKRKKSDQDHEEMGRVEFQGGLYFNEKIGPFIPRHMINALLVNGARKKKLGTIFESCVKATQSMFPLIYKGPRTREALWADPQFRDRRCVGVQQARVIRTRPRFTDWELEFEVALIPCELNPENIKDAVRDAGLYCGLGDGRPEFGQFTLKGFRASGSEDSSAVAAE